MRRRSERRVKRDLSGAYCCILAILSAVHAMPLSANRDRRSELTRAFKGSRGAFFQAPSFVIAANRPTNESSNRSPLASLSGLAAPLCSKIDKLPRCPKNHFPLSPRLGDRSNSINRYPIKVRRGVTFRGVFSRVLSPSDRKEVGREEESSPVRRDGTVVSCRGNG